MALQDKQINSLAVIMVYRCTALLTELHQIVDSQQYLHLGRDGLNGSGAVLLVDAWEVLGTAEAFLQQSAHQHIPEIPI